MIDVNTFENSNIILVVIHVSKVRTDTFESNDVVVFLFSEVYVMLSSSSDWLLLAYKNPKPSNNQSETLHSFCRAASSVLNFSGLISEGFLWGKN